MASCWKRFLGIGLLIFFLSFLQFQLLFLSSSPSSPISAISSSQQIAIQSARPLQTAILLQISPVDPSHRLHRLLAIDRGWAIWQYPRDSNSPTFDIYAPHFQSMDHDFQNIQVIPVTGVNPFVRMIEGFFAVILKSSPKYDWILFGNDHTFLIPANLHCYLKKCDKNSLLYTGNRLHVTFRGKFINFASGGAGAVLSRPALISILAVWTVLHPSMINEILGKFSLERNFNKVPPDLFQQNVTISTVDGFFSDYEIFSILSNWTENFSLKGDDCRRITLIFSSTRSLSFVMSFVSQKPILTAKYVDSSMSKLSPAPILTQYCSCSTTWDYDNPGIILAACLQEVFGVTLLPAQSSIDPTQELFNVYGLVRTFLQVMKDFDPWYNEIKSIEKLNPVVKSPSALDTISFHYVSQNESTLLYQMLSTQCLLKGQNIDSRALHQLWPSAPQHIGHYSRKIKNEYEANLTYIHLCHRLTVMLCD